MDERITTALKFVFEYASHVDDFLVIKKELLRALPPELRKQFSSKDPKTRRQRTNEFEEQLAQEWAKLTGRPAKMPPIA